MPDPNAILLGVTGGIAIYKAADLCSKLSGAGYDVHVMMTDSARHLISDKLFFTLSRNPVIFDLWDTPTWKPGHIEISELASLMVIAAKRPTVPDRRANISARASTGRREGSGKLRISLLRITRCFSWI